MTVTAFAIGVAVGSLLTFAFMAILIVGRAAEDATEWEDD